MLGAEQTPALLAMVCVSAAIGYAIDASRWGTRVPGIFIAVLIPMALTAGDVIPTVAPLYDVLGANLIPLAVALLLVGADLRRIYRVGGPLLLIFALACVATLAGVLIAGHLFDLGPDRAAISAVMAGTYIGGSTNLLAISQLVEWSSPSALSVAFAADAVGGLVFLAVIMLAPNLSGLRRILPSEVMESARAGRSTTTPAESASLTLEGLFLALALAAGIVAASFAIADLLGIRDSALLVISCVALLIGNLRPEFFARTRGPEALGTMCIYLFMPVIGAMTDLRTLTGTALEVVGFALSIVGIHLLLLAVATRFLRFDLAAVLIASNAAVLGPSTAAAMASSFHWRSLVAPGLMCGLLGGAIANFIGVAVYRLLSP